MAAARYFDKIVIWNGFGHLRDLAAADAGQAAA